MVEAKDLFDAATGIAAGVSGILAAGASVTTILGTSTVIAGGIDGVTGASAITSALAMLGGGAVAVGGAGMIGGGGNSCSCNCCGCTSSNSWIAGLANFSPLA